MRYWPTTGIAYWSEWYLPHNGGCNLSLCDGHAKWYPMNGRQLSGTCVIIDGTSQPYRIPGLYIMPDASQ